jgi:flagellar motor switch protein FliN/FliY
MSLLDDIDADVKAGFLEFFDEVKKAFVDTVSKANFEDVSATELAVEAASDEILSKAHGDKAVVFKGALSRGIDAPLGLVVNQEGFITTLAKMLMMESDKEAAKRESGLDDEDLDALREIGAQIFSNVGVFLGGYLKEETAGRFEDVEFVNFEGAESGLVSDNTLTATCRFGKEGSLSILMHLDLFDAVRMMLAPEEKEKPAEEKPKRKNLKRILKLILPVTVMLAEKQMNLESVLSWTTGTIIEFDKNHGEFLDIIVSGKTIGRGEAVKIGENFGLRIRLVGSPRETIEKLS